MWGLLLYVSWQLCAAISALLLFFYFMPTYAMIMVGVIAWFLFLVILPRIILATELSIGMLSRSMALATWSSLRSY